MAFRSAPRPSATPDDALLEEFRRLGREARLEAGSFLWQEGDPAGLVVLLEEGALDVMLEEEDGQVVVLRSLEPGSLLGEMSCFDQSAHSATVRAAVPSRICRMSVTQFRELARRHPEFLEALLTRQSERLRTLGVQVARLAFESVPRRVARFLLDATAGTAAGTTAGTTAGTATPTVRMTHQDIAMRIAATRESVSKALGSLARAGRVRLSRGTVEVLDRPGLEEEVQEGRP